MRTMRTPLSKYVMFEDRMNLSEEDRIVRLSAPQASSLLNYIVVIPRCMTHSGSSLVAHTLD